MRGLQGKVIVVAGGAGGIGTATSIRLAQEGAAVVIGDLNADAAAEVAGKITADGGQATAAALDISNEDSVGALITTAITTYGRLDGLHANAADLSPDNIGRDSNAVDVPLEVFDHTIAVNLRGHLLCTRAAIPEMLKTGGGALAYTSSAAAFVGEPERPCYAMAKAGICALVRHVASHWGKQGIRANAVAPGLVVTPTIAANAPDEFKAYALNMARSPRLGTPDDIAAAIAYLLSEDGAWINGQVYGVDGGAILR